MAKKLLPLLLICLFSVLTVDGIVTPIRYCLNCTDHFIENPAQIPALKVESNTELPEKPPIYTLTEPYQKSDDIAGIQSFLKTKGFYKGPIDGVYGPGTAEAVAAFREQEKLTAGNFVDDSFYAALSKIYEDEFLPPAQEINVKSGDPFIVISLTEHTLYLMEKEGIRGKFPVAIGKPSTPSPIGEWEITDKGAWGEGFGSRWLGLSVPWGIFGIHGTNRPYSVGAAISGGCFRMFNRDVIELYDLVKVGSKVFIIYEPFGVLGRGFQELYLGSRGSHVYFVQRRLRQLGLYKDNPDGIYGGNSIDAVKEFQKNNNLPVTGRVTASVYEKMGLIRFE